MENDLSGDYQLANDIDCDGFDAGDGKGFRPVGVGGWIYTPFEGHFDGNGHVIRNLTINRPLEDSVGLFGLAGASLIERVGLEDVSIVGYEAVGAVVGATEGTLVREVYATGSTSGHLSGGVVGFLKHEGILRDSYSRLTVDWEWQGGLLCDYLYYDAHLERSYAVGTGDEGRIYGDIGEGGDVIGSFFDCTVAGDCSNEGGETTANLKSQSFLTGQGWDFTNVWAISSVDGYPCLRWQPGCGSSCTATGPDTDCDGVDDDCDGTADDNYASQSTSCGTGVCARTGSTSCVSGSVQNSCTPGTPASNDATCNGADEDCNGSNDEDFVSQATSCGMGPCARTGITACVNGSVQNSCTPGTPASSDATCNGVDEDCSGAADEDYAAQATNCGVGACAATGSTACVAGAVVDGCTPGSPGASDATCNGTDEDCSGAADEDFVPVPSTCGVGACVAQGAITCVNGVPVDSCLPGTPASTDGCGGGDEDCDGYVDEDCCVPTTCAGQQANCGTVDDGCGGTLNCGTCDAPETCGGGGISNACGVANLPPPTNQAAPPITSDVAPTAFEAISYLFSGANPIQAGVQPGAIGQHSVVAVRGRVMTVQEVPLAGVRVSISGHPELGFTYSRNDGTYDIAFNGGGAALIEFTRPGYLPVQRLLKEDWHTQAVVDDVVLTRLDPISATINPNLPTVQAVEGPTETDESGARRPLLLIPPGTNPTAEVAGQSVPLDTMTLRITEYTVGNTGVRAMPAALPSTSAYTYAVELSADEVGPTTNVRFARALPYYLDNFLDFPVGAAVPLGYYDRAAGVWVPDDDGIILRIHSIAGGTVSLTVDDEDPNPASAAVLASLGIEPWELEQLAARYPVGKTLWRVALKHFTPWDLNMGLFAPKPPDAPKPPAIVQRPTCENHVAGSIINCQGRVLMERIPLGDTGLTLQYQSDRVADGVQHLNEIEIPLPEEAPEGTRQIRLEISVGRRQVRQLYLPVGTPSYRYVWDGLDADGRSWPGPIEITVRIAFDIDFPYLLRERPLGVSTPSRSFGGAVACPSGCDCLGGGQGAAMARESTRIRNAQGSWWSFAQRRHTIGAPTTRAFGLGGWNLTNHHHYSPLKNELYLGTGQTRRLDDEVRGIVPFAGMGSTVGLGDEVESDRAFSADLSQVRNVAGSPDGTLYFQMDGPDTLWKVTADGKLRRVPVPSFLQGGAKLLTVDPQGRPYLAHGNVIGRLEPTASGVAWHRVAGAAQPYDPDYSTQPRPAWSNGSAVREVTFQGFTDAAVSPDGITYLVAQVPQPGSQLFFMSVILRVGADGRGEQIFTPAMNAVRIIELDAQQRLIIVDQANRRILGLRPNGVLDTIAGGGTTVSSAPTMALSAWLGSILDLTVTNDGYIYFIADGLLRSVSPTGELSQICLSEVPKSPYYTNGGPQPCGVPASLASLPDGRLIIGETLERRLLAMNARLGGWPIQEPSDSPTSTFWTENRCIQYDAENGVCTGTVLVHHYYVVRYIQYIIPSEDGTEWYYFDDYGQHRSTTDARSGRPIVAFGYDGAGRIISVWRPDVGRVAIDRSGGGIRFIPDIGDDVVASGSPYLTQVDDDTSSAGWSMSYQGNGLLTSFWDRRGNRAGNQSGVPYRFTWEEVKPVGVSADARGIMMLRTDTDPSDAVQTLATNPGQAFYEPIHGATWCGAPVVTGWDFVTQTSVVTRDSAENRRTTYETRAQREYRDPANTATRYVERTASVTSPEGARMEWTDRRPDGTQEASGPGWTSVVAELNQRTTALDTKTTSATTTLAALASDGAAPSAARTALAQTSTSTRTRAYGPPTEPARFTETQTVVRTATGLPTRTSTTMFDATTRTMTATSPANRSAAFVEDAAGRVAELRAPGQVPTSFRYDSAGRLVQVLRQKGGTLRLTNLGSYVGRRPGLITSRVSSTQSTSVTLGYLGDFVSSVGVTGAPSTALTPDESKLPLTITPPTRPGHGLGYDARGLGVSYAPPAATATENPAQCPNGTQCVTYNGDRQVSAVRLTDGTSLVYTYTGGATNDGLLHGISVPGSGDTAFTYDAAGRLATATAPDGATVSLAHQASLLARSRWSGTHTVRDGSTTVWTGTLDGDVKGFYNAFLDLDTLQVVGGYHARFARDLDGLIIGVTNVAGGTSVPALSLTRSPLDGSVTNTTVGSVTTTQQFDVSATEPGYGDLMGLGASFGGNALFITAYEHDDLGRITQLSETVQGTPRVRRYEYDPAGRLTHVRDGQDVLQAQYQYDENGNRTQVTIGAETELVRCPDGRATNDLDQLCDHGDTSFTYDARGALSQTENVEGTTTFTYDGLGLLKKVILPSGDVIHYVHDAMGRRTGKVLNGQLVKGWLYADSLRPIAQLNAAGQIEATYVYGSRANVPDLIVENNGSSPVTYRVVADHLGTPRLVVRVSDGVVVHRLDVDEFGRVVNESGTRQDLHPFGFAAGLRDRDTGLVRFGARDYDPYTSKWTARDPILFEGGDPNLYAYVGNDPVNLIDPSGTDAWSMATSFGSGVVAGAAGALAVGALAAGAVALGAPAVVVSGALLGAAIAGGAVLGLNVGLNLGTKNWDGLAFDAGTMVGGAGVGRLGGRWLAETINGVTSPAWSIKSDWGQRFMRGLGSVGDWWRTGFNPGSAGGSAGAAGAGAAAVPGLCDNLQPLGSSQ